MRFTRYKDVKYSIDTHTRKILIAHFTDKTVDISYTKIMNAVLNCNRLEVSYVDSM